MVEQAALDRNLFQSSPGSAMVDLKFPEYVHHLFFAYHLSELGGVEVMRKKVIYGMGLGGIDRSTLTYMVVCNL